MTSDSDNGRSGCDNIVVAIAVSGTAKDNQLSIHIDVSSLTNSQASDGLNLEVVLSNAVITLVCNVTEDHGGAYLGGGGCDGHIVGAWCADSSRGGENSSRGGENRDSASDSRGRVGGAGPAQQIKGLFMDFGGVSLGMARLVMMAGVARLMMMMTVAMLVMMRLVVARAIGTIRRDICRVIRGRGRD